jgi:hypothetical protein
VADSNGNEVVKQVSSDGPREVVADRGYHGRAVVSELTEWACAPSVRNRIADRSGGQSKSGNNRRCMPIGGLRLLRQRGEMLERWNQHLYDRGGIRRLHVRGRETFSSAGWCTRVGPILDC